MRVALKPDAPGDPTFVASTKTTMQFRWTSPQDAARSNGGTDLLGYIIQWDNGDPAASSLTQLVQIENPLQLDYTIDNASTSLVTGTVYRIRVLAYNSIGTGAPSTILQ